MTRRIGSPNPRAETVPMWLAALGLLHPPFVTEEFIELGSRQKLKLPELPSTVVEIWVRPCFLAAQTYGGTRRDWRAFLVLLSATPMLARALESVTRLGEQPEQLAFVMENFRHFTEATRETPQLDGLAALSNRRARRLDGRATRAPDALYEAEARLGRAASDRGAFGPKKKPER